MSNVGLLESGTNYANHSSTKIKDISHINIDGANNFIIGSRVDSRISSKRRRIWVRACKRER